LYIAREQQQNEQITGDPGAVVLVGVLTSVLVEVR
jgi:preprotein translocase subunit Sec61beta